VTRNAETFRSLNERIAAEAGVGLEIVCECETEACTERVVITPVEFEEVRRRRGCFIVRPGHETGYVLQRLEGFTIERHPA
jgi:hypothetical protein